jgi:hypothetical protein
MVALLLDTTTIMQYMDLDIKSTQKLSKLISIPLVKKPIIIEIRQIKIIPDKTNVD